MTVGPYYRQDSMYYMTDDQLVEQFNEWQRDAGLPTLRTHKVVCPECEGTGSHVNRSIDGQGLDPNDPDLDDDFWDAYRSGAYDVRCTECGGRNVVDEVDEESTDPATVEAWHEYLRDHDDLVAENLAELRFGA